ADHLFLLFSSSSTLRPPLRSTLFPYTTLFRSWRSTACPIRPCSPPTSPWPRRATSSPSASAACPACPPGRRSRTAPSASARSRRSEEHTSELQSQSNLVCRLLLEKKKKKINKK